ncbi:MAG: PASTA domain-containing protein [Bacteroidales bacterium]|jgi:beta-lactam-binding protein with PASTA domain
MSLIKFFKSRIFFIQLGLAVVSTIILIWIATLFLGLITKHGEDITVPDLTGLKIEDLDSYLGERHLEYLIIDSVYNLKGKKGTVIGQDPYPNSKVKSGRRIYVTVIAKLPEHTTMPDLKDLSLRQSMAVLETYGLKVGKLKYIPDIAKNAVLKQYYKGNPIESGTTLEKGSVIDLALGRGEKSERTTIPFLLGMSRNDAIKMINEYSLNIGEENFEDGADTTNARVYKQNPAYSKKSSISLGSSVELWYKSEKKFNFNAYLKKYKNDTISNEK